MVSFPNIMKRDQFSEKPTTFELETGYFSAKNLPYNYPNSAVKYFKLVLGESKFVLKIHSRYTSKSQEHNYRSNSIVCAKHTQIAEAARYSVSTKVFFQDYVMPSIKRRMSEFVQHAATKPRVPDEMEETMWYEACAAT